MQIVCQQNIKVKRINVTGEQSWAVYRDGELGVAEGTFLGPYGTALPPPPKQHKHKPFHATNSLGAANPLFL